MCHDVTKPTKWVCVQRRLRSAWASAQPDQSALHAKWVAKDPSFLPADSEDSDQTGRMSRLIWVFAGCTLILLVLSWGGSNGFTVPLFLSLFSLTVLSLSSRSLLKSRLLNSSEVPCPSCLEKNSNIWATSRENLFLPYANNKGAVQPVHPRSLISTLVVCCLDSIILLVSISEISSLYLASVVAQAGLSHTWLQTPKTGFLVTRLILRIT